METIISFQSTLPVGGATVERGYITRDEYISIHAPRGGSDYDPGHPAKSVWHFNPRSPWGERRVFTFAIEKPIVFQSTLPVGGATEYIGIGRVH